MPISDDALSMLRFDPHRAAQKDVRNMAHELATLRGMITATEQRATADRSHIRLLHEELGRLLVERNQARDRVADLEGVARVHEDRRANQSETIRQLTSERAEALARVAELEAAAQTTAKPADQLEGLRIYGASDDLVEVRGYVDEEFNATGGYEILVITDPAGARIWVSASFDRWPLQGVGEGWAIAVLHADPDWQYPVSVTNPAGTEGTVPVVNLAVPAGTTVESWTPQ